MRVDRPAVDRVLVSPHVLEQAVPRLHPPPAPRQDLQQAELRRCQGNAAAADLHRVAGNIDLNVADLQMRSRLIPGPDPRQLLSDPDQELARAEGLRHVVVRAELESEDAVHLRRARRQHDDRDRAGHRIAPQDLAHLQPVHFGKHEVEDDQVGMLVPGDR